MPAGLILDGVIAVLLLLTIGYCAALMRRLGNLRGAQSELRGLIDGFGDSIVRAEKGIAGLKKAGADAAGELDDRIAEADSRIARQTKAAQTLADDLKFMSEKAEQLADRLERAIDRARVMPTDIGPPAQAEAAPLDPAAEIAKRAPIAPSVPAPRPAAAPPAPRPGPVAPDELMGEDEDDWGVEIDPTDEDLGPRSKVERDLLQALRGTK